MNAGVFRRVQRYGWDAASAAYGVGWVPLLQSLTRECVLRADLRPGERVLDVATGTGVGAFVAADLVGSTGQVIGQDVSEQMVARANAQARAERTDTARPRFERRDMEDSGAAAAGFDAVTIAFGLMYAADRAAALNEAGRVLAPHGRISICVWGQRRACAWAEVFPIVDARVQSEVCPLFFSLGAVGALRFALERAGFVDIVEERRAVVLSWPSQDEAAAAMLEGGPVALAWKRFSPSVRAEVRAEYLASIAAHRVAGGYQVPSEVVFASASKPG